MDFQIKPPPIITFQQYYESIHLTDTVKTHGKVTQVVGLLIESEGPAVKVGEICNIFSKGNPVPTKAEVVGFKRNKVLLMPLGEMSGISPGCEVQSTGKPLMVKVGEALRGRVLGGLGLPIDGLGPIDAEDEVPIYRDPPNPITRPRINRVLPLGVRAIDGLLTFGRGQRIGIFAGSGVGKSTTLSMIARNTQADVNVLALVGERGRELRDFLERDLGEEGMKRSVVVVATSDQPALVRLKGAYVGTAVAEYFRDKGYDVMLMMDSVTRFAMAQREVGLSVGEPPATKGYTPSVFALLPKLMERSGTSKHGTITGIYTVLVEGDDMNEPIADATRGILDGHIELSRKIAARNHYPAINIPTSVSRLFPEVATKEHQEAAGKLREVLSIYEKNEDLINIGAYQKGSSRKVDWAIDKIDDVNDFLKQGIFEPAPFEEVINRLIALFGEPEPVEEEPQEEQPQQQTYGQPGGFMGGPPMM
ncbi:MAG: flagellar protein export ATPase FliI [Candidatus Eremiobacteraeota bacterium]|nr:flagellar protein export ATPase FliI [Candidatus Eremiobacteraeota bacterium]